MIGILGADEAEIALLAKGRQHHFEGAIALLGDKGDVRQRVGDRHHTACRHIGIGIVEGDIFPHRDRLGERLGIVLQLRQLRGGLADTDGLSGNVFRLGDGLVTGLLQNGNRASAIGAVKR